ncbi:hypothetical protein O9Z70_06405 [Devosia sp. YIM 151766]|uniref:hypothetical protein n=1 Tax=Devosia sp. YIM 151766 TaxID=3017325 RepID=UPI00255CF48A|nr:hypothetical protein [Devosia sp. YIM 151766]WIY54149.1 hypothetical protein O9Z70_06405 [Devosia sp. YIM 151766]
MLSYTDPAVTVQDSDAYLVAAGQTWTGTDEAKAAAIIRGQRYVASIGNGRWAADWDNDQAPEPVRFAIIEAAQRELAAPGSLSPDYVASKVVRREKKQVGPLAKELEYAEATSAASVRPDIEIIDQLLAGQLRAAGGASVCVLRV